MKKPCLNFKQVVAVSALAALITPFCVKSLWGFTKEAFHYAAKCEMEAEIEKEEIREYDRGFKNGREDERESFSWTYDQPRAEKEYDMFGSTHTAYFKYRRIRVGKLDWPTR